MPSVGNSWYGKFHGEMRMWHQAFFAGFGRPEIFARSTEYYLKMLDEAKDYAKLQGFKGAVRLLIMLTHHADSF